MAFKQFDILTDESGDLASEKGDFAVGDATQQHQRDLLVAGEGEYKQSPLVGVGIIGFIDDEGPSELVRKIRSQYIMDGMDVTGINHNGQELRVEAEYV